MASPPPSETSPLLRDESSATRSPTTTTTSQQADNRPVSRTVRFEPTAGTTSSRAAHHAPSGPPGREPSLLSSSYPRGAGSPSLQTLGPGPGGQQPVLTALNSKLRRRHSQEAPYRPAAAGVAPPPQPPKIGPQRSTKNTQKLKLLPNPVTGEEDEWVDDGVPRDVYSQIKRIKEPTARRDAARLGKADRDRLPRVAAYCTAGSYRLEAVLKYLKARAPDRGTNPKLFDECVYSPYNYDHKERMRQMQKEQELREQQERQLYAEHEDISNHRASPPLASGQTERRFSDSELEVEGHKHEQRESLIDMHQKNGRGGADDYAAEHHPTLIHDDGSHSSSHLLTDLHPTSSPQPDPDFDTTIHTPEVFFFDYGTVVIWGMTRKKEAQLLNEVSKFADSVLSSEDMQVENFNFYYTRDYQARIYNDFISLRDPRSYMTKLAISHALSQSVKTSLFEDLVSETIATTSPLPAQIAQTGSVQLTRRQINMQIGELFILRINLHLQGSVLDSPELMWAEPHLDPVYQAVRSYLEMDQRVGLLTERLEVIADLLAVLKDQLSHRHGEYLEWIGMDFVLSYFPRLST